MSEQDYLNQIHYQEQNRPEVDNTELCDCCQTKKDRDESEWYQKRLVWVCWDCLQDRVKVRHYIKSLQ